MEYNSLGKTGMNVSRVGFGGIPIQHLIQDKVDAIIDRSIEVGINFFDTARGYTTSEEFLGNALYGYRDKVFIATKSMVRDKDGMMEEVKTSLRNLRTDYIDLYQLHNIGSIEELDLALGNHGAYAALTELKREGIIRHIGITSHKAGIIEKALDTDFFETIQFPLNAVERQGEGLFERAYKNDIGTIAMKPMAGGALRDGEQALKFILENPYLSVAIPGMDSVEQVNKNARAACGIPLTDDERENLIRTAQKLGNKFCRRCGYCLPCPQGINIPMMFLVEGYYTRYDLKEWAIMRYNTQEKKAGDCIKCGICETKCPYELPIRDMLGDVKDILG